MKQLLFILSLGLFLGSCSKNDNNLYVVQYRSQQLNAFGESAWGSHNMVLDGYLTEEDYDCTLYSYYLWLKYEAKNEGYSSYIAERWIEAYERDPSEVKIRWVGYTDHPITHHIVVCSDTESFNEDIYEVNGTRRRKLNNLDENGNTKPKRKWNWFGSTSKGI